jgi:hypothetical protein
MILCDDVIKVMPYELTFKSPWVMMLSPRLNIDTWRTFHHPKWLPIPIWCYVIRHHTVAILIMDAPVKLQPIFLLVNKLPLGATMLSLWLSIDTQCTSISPNVTSHYIMMLPVQFTTDDINTVPHHWCLHVLSKPCLPCTTAPRVGQTKHGLLIRRMKRCLTSRSIVS